MPAGTPLLLGGDWNCVAEDLDLIGGQPGTRQHGFQSGLLPFQQALLSSLDRRLPSHACEGAEQGITLDELQAALKLSARGKKPGSDGFLWAVQC